MSEFIKIIWNDSVWSKVIAAGILALISLISDNVRTLALQYWHYLVLSLLILIIYLQQRNLKSLRKAETYNEIDRRTYNNAQNLLRKNNLMEHIRLTDFTSAFRDDIFEYFDEIDYDLTRNPVEYEFIDKNFNILFTQIITSITAFSNHLATNTWKTGKDNRLSQIPVEWPEKLPDRFTETVKKIYQLRQEICDNYDEFTRQGRIKFPSINEDHRVTGQ